MRIIIAGSRTITGKAGAMEVLGSFTEAIAEWGPLVVTEIVTGGAKGVDEIGKRFAEKFGLAHREFPADWDKHGKRAGYLRNVEMAEHADALVLVWDGKSAGSRMMKEIAEKRGMPVYERVVR